MSFHKFATRCAPPVRKAGASRGRAIKGPTDATAHAPQMLMLGDDCSLSLHDVARRIDAADLARAWALAQSEPDAAGRTLPIVEERSPDVDLVLIGVGNWAAAAQALAAADSNSRVAGSHLAEAANSHSVDRANAVLVGARDSVAADLLGENFSVVDLAAADLNVVALIGVEHA